MAASKKKAVKSRPASADTLVTDVLDGLREEMGDDGAQLLGSDGLALKIRGVISTQGPTVDEAIGRGGIPLGRVTILHGKEGCGKTTLALHVVAECHRQGGLAVYFDKEYKLDPDYAEGLGCDPNKFMIVQPKTLEKVLRGIKTTVEKVAANRKASGKRKPVVIVIDSINACIAKAVLDGEEEDHHIAPEARLWSRHLPEIVEMCSREDIALMLISQVRKKINVQFGDDNEIAGGNAPRFYASLIMFITRTGTEKHEGKKVGNKCEVECKKNQIAPPFKKAEFIIRYGHGIDFEHSLISWAVKNGVVDKSGAWYSLDGERIGQGIYQASAYLRKHDEIRSKLYKKFRAKMGWS